MPRRPTVVHEDDDINERRRMADRWHVGKEIPIVLVAAVLLQTAGGIWWMAQLSAKIDNAVSSISEFKVERYTREDARRDRELMEQKLTAYSKSDADIERRINTIESRVDRVEQRADRK